MARQNKTAQALIEALEKSQIKELAEIMMNTRKLLFRSFLSGIMRGLGAAIGFSVLGAIALLLLQNIIKIDFLK